MRLKLNIEEQNINNVHVTGECILDFVNYINEKQYTIEDLKCLPDSTKLETEEFEWNLETQITFLKCPTRRRWLSYLWHHCILDNLSMKGVNLEGFDLSGAKLSNANLAGVNLSGARLYKTDLENSKLGHADLSKSVIIDSNLKGTDLRCADLEESHISETFMTYAKLAGASLLKASITNTNLTGIEDMCSFNGPYKDSVLVHKSIAYKDSLSNIYIQMYGTGMFLEEWQSYTTRSKIGKQKGYSEVEVETYYDIVRSSVRLLGYEGS